MEETQTENRR
uniref:Uncharacterized protein n=1 Tax=Anguilla anguilla TaxID=7936 RepID=A0A0E9QES1_ANGAN